MQFLFVFVFLVLYSITTGHDLQCCQKLESMIYRNTRLLKELLRRHPKEIPVREVAFGKSCRQSSTGWGEYASKAVDGDLNTYMHTGKDQSPYWIVDLGKPYQIKQIEIFNRKHGDINTGLRLRDLDIIVGTSPYNMHLCAHYAGPAQLGDHIVLVCQYDETARYVKLMLRRRDFLHVAEVKVYAL
ncbi:uncharacterized protein LOC134683986 [Mytilus trossulus]|uniref:uncharacterized protein LOC134683986 n=1 Tax=Mytilus trossulus TaxID=6551 RepID=UPI0030066A99